MERASSSDLRSRRSMQVAKSCRASDTLLHTNDKSSSLGCRSIFTGLASTKVSRELCCVPTGAAGGLGGASVLIEAISLATFGLRRRDDLRRRRLDVGPCRVLRADVIGEELE